MVKLDSFLSSLTGYDSVQCWCSGGCPETKAGMLHFSEYLACEDFYRASVVSWVILGMTLGVIFGPRVRLVADALSFYPVTE